jgi:hypothetical protein
LLQVATAKAYLADQDTATFVLIGLSLFRVLFTMFTFESFVVIQLLLVLPKPNFSSPSKQRQIVVVGPPKKKTKMAVVGQQPRKIAKKKLMKL